MTWKASHFKVTMWLQIEFKLNMADTFGSGDKNLSEIDSMKKKTIIETIPSSVKIRSY